MGIIFHILPLLSFFPLTMSDHGAKKRKQEPSTEHEIIKDALIAKQEDMISRLNACLHSLERSSEGWLSAKDLEIEFWHNLYSKGHKELEKMGDFCAARGNKLRRLERLITKCPSCSERLQLGEGGSSSSAPALDAINVKDAAS
jgi:hypothetical protein